MEEPDALTTSIIFLDGYQAGLKGELQLSPFPVESEVASVWLDGWEEGSLSRDWIIEAASLL